MDLKKIKEELVEINKLAAPLQRGGHDEASKIIDCCTNIQSAIRDYERGLIRRELELKDKISPFLNLSIGWADRLRKKLPSNPNTKTIQKKIVGLVLNLKI